MLHRFRKREQSFILKPLREIFQRVPWLPLSHHMVSDPHPFPNDHIFKKDPLADKFLPPRGDSSTMHIFVYARDESSNWELILVTGFSRLGNIEIYQPVTMGTNNTQLLPCILNMVDLISLFVASPFWTARR